MGRPSYTAEQRVILDRLIRERYESEGSLKIAAEVGVPDWAVVNRARYTGFRCPSKAKRVGAKNAARRDARREAIRARYAVEGAAKLAQEFGVTAGSICQLARQIGIGSPTYRERGVRTLIAENGSVDQEYLNKWSPNMAWLLGYIWADGSVIEKHPGRPAVLSFVCKGSDAELLESIRHELRITRPVRRRVSKVNYRQAVRHYERADIYIASERFVSRLVKEFGIPPRKTYTDPPMPTVPDEWLPHYARGVVDGDGWLTSGQRIVLGICGSKRFLHTLADRIATAVGVRRPTLSNPRRGSGILWTVQWTARKDLDRLLPWAYPPGDYISLARKRNLANGYVEQRQAIS